MTAKLAVIGLGRMGKLFLRAALNAIEEGRLDAETAWGLSRIDEDFQAEQWGDDEEAAALAARRRADFLQAETFLRLLRS